MSPSTQSRAFLAVFILALLLRLTAAWAWQSQCNTAGSPLKFGDSHSYWIIARNVVHEGTYQYGSDQSKIFRAPVYPLFLTPFVALEAPLEEHHLKAPISPTIPLLVRFAGSLLGAACVWLLMHWTRSLCNLPLAPILTGLLATLYCGAVGMSIFVLSEALATPLFILATYWTWLAVQPKQKNIPIPKKFSPLLIPAATALATACLTRPSWSLWLPIACLYILFASYLTHHKDRKTPLLQSAIFMIVFLLSMTPWWIRNYSITGKFVPTTLQVGASLYDGWHPNASGSSDENMAFSTEFLQSQLQQDQLLASEGKPLESTLEWRIDRRLLHAAYQWAFENTSDVVKLGLVKFLKTWMPMPIARELGNPCVRWWEAGSYSTIMLLAAWGLCYLAKSRPLSALWIAMPCLYLAVLHAVFIGSVRYRQPGVLILCVLAGIGAAHILSLRFPNPKKSSQPSITPLPENTAQANRAQKHSTTDEYPRNSNSNPDS